MSKLVWTQPDGIQKTYDFDPEDLLWAEVRAIQKVTGANGLIEIGEMLERADASAIPAVLWVMRKREGEANLSFEECIQGLRIRDVSMEADDEESPKDEAPETPTDTNDPSQPSPTGSDSTPGTSSD